MIRRLTEADFQTIFSVVNDAADAYRGNIPADRWKTPYMSTDELRGEIESGVQFYGWEEGGVVVAVMGIQHLGGVTLIRHAYTLTNKQRKGFGEKLLKHLLGLAQRGRVLVGTWESAPWAIKFYEKHGFVLLSREETNRLLRQYWSIPERQVETSVVLELKRQHP